MMKLVLLLVGTGLSAAVSLPAAGVSRSHAVVAARTQCRRLLPPSMAADDVKISIKPRSAVTVGTDTPAESGDSKVSVRVRPASERAASVATEDTADTADTTTTIKVNAPAKAPAPPPPPEIVRSPEEEMLLNGTQAANCTRILEALKAGANPNICDPKGRTPLHFMAGVGLAPAMVLLIHFGAQLNVKDNDGLTPLHMAAGYANARSLRVLLAAGADSTIAGLTQGPPLEVVKQMGEYQWDQVYGSGKKQKRELFKPKKDEKLEKLKDCVTALLDPEKVREEEDWDELVRGALRVIAI